MATQQQSGAERNQGLTMEEHIEEWARQVCEAIKASGPMPLASLARGMADATTNEVAMALGWLVHDGGIRFTRRGGVWEISLREPNRGEGMAR